MTEIIKTSINMNDILLKLEKYNPNSSRNELIKKIGHLITESYYFKIQGLESKGKSERFEQKKLLLHKRRETMKGQKRIETKIKKDEKLSEYDYIKKRFFGLFKFYDSNNYFNNINFLKFDERDSSDVVLDNRLLGRFFDKDDFNGNGFKVESAEIDIDITDRETIDKNSLIKSKPEIQDQTLSIELFKQEDSVEIKDKKLTSSKDIYKISEPDNFYIETENIDDLIIDSEEEMRYIMKNLKEVKYNKNLAEFILEDDDDIEDLTED